MQTREIPRSEWPAFLSSFSSRHQGWLVNLEVFGPDIGAQVEGKSLVLQGVSDDWDQLKRNTVVIMAGDKPGKHLTHAINRPAEISLEKTDSGLDAVLSIKAEDGTRTLLSFPWAVSP